jgi:Na+-driven multidrug efflux pump
MDLFMLPPLAIAKEFWPFVIPVTTTAIGRISGYLAMSHVASSALGVTDMAAQAVIFSFFCCLTPVCDSLNLTAQSFVPAIFEKKPSKARADALRQTLRNFSKVGGMFGAVLVAMVATIPVLSRYFTADMAVRTAVNQAIPGLSLFFALSGLVCVGEGMLLGQKDLRFLGNAYGAYFFAVPYFLLRLKKRALLGLQDVGVGTMWRTFSFYQVIRCCIWFARMTQLQRRTDRQVEESEITKS